MRIRTTALLLLFPLAVFAQRPSSTGSSPASSPPPSPPPSATSSAHSATSSPTPSPPTHTSSSPTSPPTHTSSPSIGGGDHTGGHGGHEASRAGGSIHESRDRSKERTSATTNQPEKKDSDLLRNPEKGRFKPDKITPCKHQPCTVPCPPGQSLDGSGKCVASRQSAAKANQQCVAGYQWNGATCAPVAEAIRQCPPGETRDGLACVDCALAQTTAANLAAEARMAKLEMESECRQNPLGQSCQAATMRHDGALQRYRMTFDTAPLLCRGAMADPITL